MELVSSCRSNIAPSVRLLGCLIAGLAFAVPTQAQSLTITPGTGFTNPMTVAPMMGVIPAFTAVDNNPPSNMTPMWSATVSGAPLMVMISPQSNGPKPSALIQLYPEGAQPGSYNVTLTVTATYSTPYSGTQSDVGTYSFVLQVVGVTFPPSPLIVGVGDSQTFTATIVPSGVTGVSYSSDTPSVASVVGSNSSFTVTGVATGTANITAMFGSTPIASVAVDVVTAQFYPNPISLVVGQSLTASVMLNPPVMVPLTFQSADPSIASVQGMGTQCTVTGNAVGSTQVQAIYNGMTLGTVPVTVSSLTVTFSPNPIYVAVGGTAMVTAQISPSSASNLVTYSTSDGTIATAMGMGTSVQVYGVSAGTTQLIASTSAGVVGTAEIDVVSVQFSPNPKYVGLGKTSGLTATVTPSSAASQVTITSMNTSIVTVSGTPPSLQVTGVALGSTTVQATVGGYPCGSVQITVVQAQFIPYRTGVNYGQAVSTQVMQSGDPTRYVILVNNNYDDGMQSKDFTAPQAHIGGDPDLAQLMLQPIGMNVTSGTLQVIFSSSGSVRTFDDTGTPITTLSVDLSNPSGPLSGLANGSVSIYFEGLSGVSDMTITYQYTGSDGTVETTDTVHTNLATYQLQTQAGSIVEAVTTVSDYDLVLLADGDPCIQDTKPDVPAPYAIPDNAWYLIQLLSLTLTPEVNVTVTSNSSSDSYNVALTGTGGVQAQRYGLVYDSDGNITLPRGNSNCLPDQLQASNTADVIQGMSARVAINTQFDSFNRSIDSVYLLLNGSTQPKTRGGFWVVTETDIPLTVTVVNTATSNTTTSWELTTVPDGANASLASNGANSSILSSDSIGGHVLTLTHNFHGLTMNVNAPVFAKSTYSPSSATNYSADSPSGNPLSIGDGNLPPATDDPD